MNVMNASRMSTMKARCRRFQVALVCAGWVAASAAVWASGAQSQCDSPKDHVAAESCPPAGLAALAQDDVIRIATFDSGFGGFMTAKSIEEDGRLLEQRYRARFSITHYGDTLNAPYGEKAPEQIAQLAAQGILHAFNGGAQGVFIACNTASTQYERIRQILDSRQPGLSTRTVSIIGATVEELKRQIDARLQTRKSVRVGILATPATVISQAYPKALARAFGSELSEPAVRVIEQERWHKARGESIRSAIYAATLQLAGGRTIEIYQVGPANWVEMIEHGAAAAARKRAVRDDLRLLTAAWRKDATFDIVGEFCTHYPILDTEIREYGRAQGLTDSSTSYIKQGPLMAGVFDGMMRRRLERKVRDRTTTPEEREWLIEFSRPRIFVSGDNVAETKALAAVIFPKDPVPEVIRRSFAAIDAGNRFSP